MTTWNEADAIFAKSLPGYQRRENQHNLALRVESALESGSHIMAQAGCGTGKSFVAAITGIRKSKETGLPTVIATATKALQDQLANKDLPFLKDVVGGFKFAVLKGRSNYVCRAKLEELDSITLRSQIAEVIESERFDGEIETVGSALKLLPVQKASLSTSSDECPGKSECPFGNVCFAEIAKAKAKDANLVVANHAVVAADMAIKANQEVIGIPAEKTTGILPRYGAVIVDEAHELNDFVTSALGGEITGGSFGRLSSEISSFLADRDSSKHLVKVSDSIFNEIAQLLARRDDKRNKTQQMGEKELAALAPALADLNDALSALQSRVEGQSTHGNDKMTQQKKRLVKKIGNAREKVMNLVLADQSALVRWLEVGEGKKGDSINWAPLTVAPFLQANLLSKVPVVFMSATLAVGNDFSPLANQLGVDEYEQFDAGTPFDFTTQARTFIPQIAHPAGGTVNTWRASATAMMKELVRASNGRALLLFTSKTELDEAYMALEPMVTKMGHKALKQGDAPNKELAKTFADDEHSVLFALKSFFTGVDIQGDSLRLVVINKMPFPVRSDVIFKARTDALDKKYGPWQGFNRLTVPTMALSLMQAYGRLIRTVNDSGVVAIMDSRLYGKTAKPYGAKIVKALPNAPVLTDLGQTVNYLESLEA